MASDKLSFFNSNMKDQHHNEYYDVACGVLSMFLEVDDNSRFNACLKRSYSRNVWFSILLSLFYQRDRNILLGMRKAFCDGFKDLLHSLNDQNGIAVAQKEIYLNQAICLLPIADIKPGQIYPIPQFNEAENSFILVPYKVSSIELTATSGIDAFVTSDEARVFAYGLEPVLLPVENGFKPQAHLIFMPLNYAGQGFASQMMSILNPFDTVGASLVKNCRAKINHFISNQFSKTGKKVCVQGFSLGGTQALLVGLDSDNKNNTQVIAYNPPGLYSIFTPGSSGESDHINIYMQNDDPISNTIGIFPTNVAITKIEPPTTYQPSAFGFMHHVSSAICLSDTTFTPQSLAQIENDNDKKWLFNIAVLGVIRPLVYGLFALPCHYILLPVIRAVLNHKTEIVLIGAVSFIFMMLPGLLTTPMGIAVLAAVSAYLAFKLIEPMLILIGLKERQNPPCLSMDQDEFISSTSFP